MPKLAKTCLESWKKHLPEYELRLWNEDSFNINSTLFTKQAYESRKFAFVTDYVRLYVLYNYGGVYMDTDVEVLKNMDHFLQYPAFSGFEDEINIPTGLMSSKKNGEWVKYLLSYYENRPFILSDGSFDTESNTSIIGKMSKKMGFVANNKLQCFSNMVHIFPKDYFCPKSQVTGNIEITENTHCIHHFAGSWIPLQERRLTQVKRKLMKLIGVSSVEILLKAFRLMKNR